MDNSKRLLPLKRTAEVMIVDSDLWVVPRYEELHLINILALERQLSTLETQINDAVNCESHKSRGQGCSPSCIPQVDLLPELQRTLKAYDDAILALAAIRKLEDPAPHVLNGLERSGRSELEANLTELLEQPPEWHSTIRRDGSSRILSVATDSRSWFHRFIERHGRLGRLFETTKPVGSENFTFYAASSVKSVEFTIVAACLCFVQLVPVMALTLVSSKAARLGIIVGLIVLVSVLNSLFAHTVQATNFGAVAAYSAIVVAFVTQKD